MNTMPKGICRRCLVSMTKIEWLTHDCDFYNKMDELGDDWRTGLDKE